MSQTRSTGKVLTAIDLCTPAPLNCRARVQLRVQHLSARKRSKLTHRTWPHAFASQWLRDVAAGVG